MFGVVDSIFNNQVSGWISVGERAECRLEVVFDGQAFPGVIGAKREDFVGFKDCYSFTALLPKPINLSDVADGKLKSFCINDKQRVELEIWSCILDAANLERMPPGNLTQIVKFLSSEKRLELISGIETPLWRRSVNKKSMCVIAYANGAGAWFPYFYSYYAGLVGAENIFIVAKKAEEFSAYPMGGIISLSGAHFDNEARAQLQSRLSQGLLAYYNWTLICDVDEIVIPHPSSGMTFEQMLAVQSDDVVLSRGFDVLQEDDDPPFDFAKSIQSQRRWGVANSSLCKPHLARVPTRWGPGFHQTDNPPSFAPPGSGFLTLHLKWACTEVRAAVARLVQSTTYADQHTAEYSNNSVAMERHHVLQGGWALQRVAVDGPEMQAFEQQCLESAEYIGQIGIWFFPHEFDTRLVDLRI